MPDLDPDRLAEEIERLRRRCASLLRGDPPAAEAPARWTCAGTYLRWHVVLEEVIEPDIDVEILPELLIIRARPEASRRLLRALLPVPAEFDAGSARIRWEIDYLEVRLTRMRAGEGA